MVMRSEQPTLSNWADSIIRGVQAYHQCAALDPGQIDHKEVCFSAMLNLTQRQESIVAHCCAHALLPPARRGQVRDVIQFVMPALGLPAAKASSLLSQFNETVVALCEIPGHEGMAIPLVLGEHAYVSLAFSLFLSSD